MSEETSLDIIVGGLHEKGYTHHDNRCLYDRDTVSDTDTYSEDTFIGIVFEVPLTRGSELAGTIHLSNIRPFLESLRQFNKGNLSSDPLDGYIAGFLFEEDTSNRNTAPCSVCSEPINKEAHFRINQYGSVIFFVHKNCCSTFADRIEKAITDKDILVDKL